MPFGADPVTTAFGFACQQMKEANGEGGVMAEPDSCEQSATEVVTSKIPRATCFQPIRSGHRRCETCGDQPAVIHIPIYYAGYFCSNCCPACSGKPVTKG